MLNLPGSLSKHIPNYINVRLKLNSFNTVLLHPDVNDLLSNNIQSSTDSLISDIQKIRGKCKGVGVRNIFGSGLMYTTRISLPIPKRVHRLISKHCPENLIIILIRKTSEGYVHLK